MDFFACTRIAFTAELSILDLFLKTVHGGHASVTMNHQAVLELFDKYCEL